MQLKLNILEESDIKLAGKGTGMHAQLLGKVDITVGGYRFFHLI